MRILYDCFSCSPYYGSDEGIGWMWPYLMRRYHEVWVLVRNDRKIDIENYCRNNKVEDIHFVYCDIPEYLNFYYYNKQRGKNGTFDFLLYQFLWQFVALNKAKLLHKKVHFDIVHHVCTNDFRLLGFMYQLNIPFIIGPIGGAQETPESLKIYVHEHTGKEKIRKVINQLMVAMPGYKKALRKANRIYFSNIETFHYLSRYIKDKGKCSLLTEIGTVDSWAGILTNSHKIDTCTFLWVGRMEYRKGLELLIDAIRKLPLEKKWNVVLCGDGSERPKIQNIVTASNFSDRVSFLGQVSYKEIKGIYREATVFVFPSLRETTGTVLLEAMSCGLPVICLKQGGAVNIVNDQTGFLIDVDNLPQCLNQFAQAMEFFIDNPEAAVRMGEKAKIHALKDYSWNSKIDFMNGVYQKIGLKKER